MWYQSQQDKGLTLYGNVDIRTVNMSFRVGGRLATLNVDEGDEIRRGQTLGELDRAPYENALQQAQANVSTAQAQYDLMMAGYRAEEIAQAAAAVNQAQAAWVYAQNFYQRQLGLRASSAISANDLENARSSRDQAQATLKSAQDKLRQYRAGNRPQEIAQAKASLEQAQAALAQAKLDLHDTVLTAPSDGTLMTRAVEPGTMLNAGGTVLTLSLTHPVWVRAYVDEKISARRSRGAKYCCIPIAGRTSPITVKSALSPQRRIHAKDRRNTGFAHRSRLPPAHRGERRRRRAAPGHAGDRLLQQRKRA